MYKLSYKFTLCLESLKAMLFVTLYAIRNYDFFSKNGKLGTKFAYIVV